MEDRSSKRSNASCEGELAMTTYAKFKASAVVFEPQAPGTVPSGSLYMDSSSSNALTTKTTGGSDVPIGATSSTDIFVKTKQNRSPVDIPANARVALRNDGSIVLADSDDPAARQSIGIALELIVSMSTGKVLLDGPNVIGAVESLGFTPGQDVFMDKIPGQYTNNVSMFNPVTDTITKVGIADTASGIVSGTATDLIMTTEVVSSATVV